jgi:large conductance mechanosensitive channel
MFADREERGVLEEFKKFILRGNVVDLAVGVVMGAAFAMVVSTLTGAFITPLIAAIGGKASFSELAFHVGKPCSAAAVAAKHCKPPTVFQYGLFLNSAFSFVITAAVVFFLVVKPINSLTQRMRKEPPADPTTKKCPECLSEIPIDARRCAFCTTELAAA